MLFEFLVRWKTELLIGALALFLLVSRCYSDSQVEHLQTALDDEIQARNQEVETMKSNQKKTEASLIEMYESYITRQKIIDSDYQTQNQTLETTTIQAIKIYTHLRTLVVIYFLLKLF